MVSTILNPGIAVSRNDLNHLIDLSINVEKVLKLKFKSLYENDDI